MGNTAREYLEKYMNSINKILEADDELLEISIKLLNKELETRKRDKLNDYMDGALDLLRDVYGVSWNHDTLNCPRFDIELRVVTENKDPLGTKKTDKTDKKERWVMHDPIPKA